MTKNFRIQMLKYAFFITYDERSTKDPSHNNLKSPTEGLVKNGQKIIFDG